MDGCMGIGGDSFNIDDFEVICLICDVLYVSTYNNNEITVTDESELLLLIENYLDEFFSAD